MKEYADEVDKIEDGCVERMRDLQEEMGQNLQEMRKDLEKERRSITRMKDNIEDFGREMSVAEDS
eukprot:1403940-Karenia_brevis.AAC.1